jgi:hypothetical protein
LTERLRFRLNDAGYRVILLILRTSIFSSHNKKETPRRQPV